MKYASALAIAGIAITLLIIGFPLLQSKAAQFDIKRQSDAARTPTPASTTSESVELGLSRELSRGDLDAPRSPRADTATPISSGWRNVWLMPLVALPMLAGALMSLLFSSFRRDSSGPDQAEVPEPHDLINRLANAERAIADREQAIEDLEARLDALQQPTVFTEDEEPDFAALETQLSARDEIIKGLEETLDENHERWMNVEINEADRQERVLRLESELRTASAIIHSLEDDVAEWKARADATIAVSKADVEMQTAAGT